MKILWSLLVKDLRRDAKHPWSIVLFAVLPLAMTTLMGLVFGGSKGAGPAPTLHIAILDQDQDLLSGILRSFPSQGEASQRLRLYFVKQVDEGIRLLEKRRVSALIVLPKNLTRDLLEGRTNVIEIYENPAQQILPKITRQGVSLLTDGLSGVVEVLREPLKAIREMVKAEQLPASAAVAQTAAQSVEHLRHYQTYLFPPLIQVDTVDASHYQLQAPPASPTNQPAATGATP